MLTTTEAALRQRLGIPRDAARVLVFGESSHWDTNWLKTSEEYFRDHIDAIFNAIFAALSHDPRRVFAIESVFFLKLYWDRRAHERERLRRLLHSGQLRLLSASLTTPDTLLPNPETILRDYLLGQEWLRANDLRLTPRISYFPDNFGHSPALPSLMNALGIDAVGVTRIDGMYFIGADYRRSSAFPLHGSTARELLHEHKSLDFVWRADDGASVLCHWNAFTYFQGDMLAHAGVIRWMGKTFGVSRRSARHIARRIRRYVRDLQPISPTPYMFCPIGCDFNTPIFDLGGLLERYNRSVYPTTGVFAIDAGLDDYLQLIGFHREKLPVLACDPNPYWMGFYSTRPEVKQRPIRIARKLLLAEKLASLAPKSQVFSGHARRAWEVLSLSNHHDYITGTSPDRVWHAEQRPWLDQAEAATEAAWQCVVPSLPPASVSPATALRWRRAGDEITVSTANYALTLSEARGGCLTSWQDGEGRELLSGLGNDLVVHHDSGGLWRLGHEYVGGSFEPLTRASAARADISVTETAAGELVIDIKAHLAGVPFVRTITSSQTDPFVRMRASGAPKARWTVTSRFETTVVASKLQMDTAGGRVERPRRRHYDPTFWPVPSHCTIADESVLRRVHVAFDTPAALALGATGAIEWIVARNAIKERAFGLLPVLAHPIGGSAPEEQHCDYAIAIEPRREGNTWQSQRRALAHAWLPSAERAAWAYAHTLIHCDDERVTVSAVKHAEDGDDMIVRLTSDDRSLQQVHIRTLGRALLSGWLADAREHPLAVLVVHGDAVCVPMTQSIVTLRLRLQH